MTARCWAVGATAWLLAGCGAGAPQDLLQPTFEWNAGLPPLARYATPVPSSTSRNIGDVVGDVRVAEWGNPKELAAAGAGGWDHAGSPKDVLRLAPGKRRCGRSWCAEVASATVTVHLTPALVGLNRLRLLWRTDAAYAAFLGPHSALARAWLAPKNRPDHVLREVDIGLVTATVVPSGNTTVTRREHRAYPGYDGLGEWAEAKAEFWILQREIGEALSMQGQTKLFVQLGAAAAYEGVAVFTGLWVVNTGIANVGVGAEVGAPDVLLGIEQEHGHGDHYHLVDRLVESEIMSDGALTGLAYTVYDQRPAKTAVTVTFTPREEEVYLCGARVWFAYAAHVSRWSLFVSSQRSGAGWREVIRVDNSAWPRSEWSFDRAKVYLSEVNGLNDTAHSIEQIEWLEQLEAAATLPGSEQRWEDELWARQELSDSPITTAAHEFNCTSAARAMLAMYHTKSDLFAVAEVELLGYNRENESLCALECRHGGTCLSSAEAGCSCPTEAWGWAGPRCRLCNRSAHTPSHYETLGVADPEADLAEITAGYRRQMVRNGGNRIKQAELTRVYEVLADVELRYAYDATRAEPCEEGAEVRDEVLDLNDHVNGAARARLGGVALGVAWAWLAGLWLAPWQ